MALCTVLLFLVTLWEAFSATDPDFCVDQPEALHVRTGGSVIIPCTFSYPRELYPDVEVGVYWRAGDGARCGTSPFIYNHTEGFTDARYRGRITLVGDPGSGSGSIRIDGLRNGLRTSGYNLRSDDLRSGDDLKYCCRVRITQRDVTPLGWQNRHMTQLVFTDAPPQSRVEQLDAIPAQVGASVTIPCRVRYSGEFDPTADLRVSWKAGSNDLCSDMDVIYNTTSNYQHEEYGGRVKLVSDPRGTGTSSLQIDGVKMSDSKRYCCVVQIGNREPWIQSAHGTGLIVGDVKPTVGFNFSVTQSNKVEVQNNDIITITCNFTQPENKDPLWTGVYWTVGEKWKQFVYHLNQESIDPLYRGRTRLIGDPKMNSTVVLQIDKVTESDRRTYYCLVAFRFCKGNNGFSSVIQQGGGTTIAKTEEGNLRLILIVAIVALFLILIISVLFLKKKGLICKGTSPGENAARSGTGVHFGRLADPEKEPPRPANFDSNHKPKVEDPVVYAALELTQPVHGEARAQPDPLNDTVYSAVKIK